MPAIFCDQVAFDRVTLGGCMTTMTIPISEERIGRLQSLAQQAGLPPEEFLRRRVDSLLDQPSEEFNKAADQVIQKNAELYRRLA